MEGMFRSLHILFCLGLVISVLLQSSKGGGLAGAFGGMGDSGSMFGGRGAATFLAKVTTYLAIFFMLSSIAQVFIIKSSRETPKSLIQQEAERSPGSNLPIVPEAAPSEQPNDEGSGSSQ